MSRKKNAPLTECLGAEVAFSLPDWFPPNRLDWERNILYPEWHAWAGSIDRIENGNSAVDALHRLKYVSETAVMQACGNWVTAKFEDIKPGDLPRQIAEFQAKLERFLVRYKEAK